MSERIHGLAQLLPDKSSLEDYTLEELQHLAKRFPYFAPVQYLLLQKMKQTAAPEAAAQQGKAVLYFHDPLLFDYFVSADKFPDDEAIFNQQEENIASIPMQAETLSFSKTALEDEAHAVHLGKEEEEPENAGLSVVDRPIEPAKFGEADISTPTINEPRDQNDIFREPDKVIQPEAVEIAEPIVLATQPLQQKMSNEQVSTGEKTAVEEAEVADENLSVVASPEVESAAPGRAGETAGEQNMNAAASAQQPAPPATEAVQEQENPKSPEPVLFEPFHTVDYFASQGIRITTDELPKDKLSKQLRSFTEWLKMMKRLPAAEMAQSPETVAEKSVESLATHSVEGSDVVTEAMAEVWARQGNRQKAIETYNKLSLLNPSKRTYFAAKIENLS